MSMAAIELYKHQFASTNRAGKDADSTLEEMKTSASGAGGRRT
jgi:hypothetical protein